MILLKLLNDKQCLINCLCYETHVNTCDYESILQKVCFNIQSLEIFKCSKIYNFLRRNNKFFVY